MFIIDKINLIEKLLIGYYFKLLLKKIRVIL
jgi:hypothetical protein